MFPARGATLAPCEAQGERRTEGSKTLQRNSVGNQPHPGKVSHRPEASFASSPERAARSVNSECRSRVIEPRKNDVVGAFVVRTAGAAPERRQRQGAEARPGSESAARASGFSLGTWETRPRPWDKHRKRMNRYNNIQALWRRASPPQGAKERSRPEAIRRNVTNEVPGAAWRES